MTDAVAGPTGRDMLRHASIYGAGAVLARMVGFLMLPFYAHLLRGAGYAVIGMVDVSLALLVSLLGYGLSNAIVVHYHEEGSAARKPRVVSTGVIIATAASLALILLPIACARLLSALLLDDPDLAPLLVIALIAFVFQMAGQAAGAWLLIRRRSLAFAGVNLVGLVVSLSLNILLILVLGWGLWGYFLSALASALLVGAIFLGIAVRDCGYAFDRDVARSMRKFMLPLIPGTVVAFASTQCERLLVKFQISLEAVGILEMGYKFPLLITQLITTPFMQSWSPRRFEIAARADAPCQIGRVFTYYCFLVSYVGLIMAVTIKPVLVLLTPPEFHLAYRIAQLEIMTLILQGCETHLNFGLFLAKHTAVVTRLRVVVALVKIGLTFVFVSTWAIYGAAFSAAIMSGVTLVTAYVLAQRRYRIELERLKLATIAGMALGLFVFLHFARLAETPAVARATARMVAGVARAADGTALATWHRGVVMTMLREGGRPIAEILVNGGIALGFGLLVPWVRHRPGSHPAAISRVREVRQ